MTVMAEDGQEGSRLERLELLSWSFVHFIVTAMSSHQYRRKKRVINHNYIASTVSKLGVRTHRQIYKPALDFFTYRQFVYIQSGQTKRATPALSPVCPGQ